jgi:hypothetical protein
MVVQPATTSPPSLVVALRGRSLDLLGIRFHTPLFLKAKPWGSMSTAHLVVGSVMVVQVHDVPFQGLWCDNPIRDNSVLSPKLLHSVIKR